MPTTIVVTLALLTVFGLAYSSLLPLAAAAACGCLYSFFLLSDLKRLLQALRGSLYDRSRAPYIGVAGLFSSFVDQLNHCLVSASQRLNYLEDEMLSNYFKGVGREYSSNQASSASSPSQSDAPVVAKLRQLVARQRADLAAYLCHNSSTGELLCFSSAHQNVRFYSQLKLKYQRFFENNDEQLLGIFDTNSISGLTENFAAYGVRFYAVVPAGIEVSGWQGLLWLGFSPTSYPDLNQRFEVVESAKVLLNLCVTSQALAELGQKVAVVSSQKKSTEQFVAHLSHDIRSPLHNVKTVLSLVKDSQVADTEKAELLQVASRNCEVLEDLVTDILDYNKHSLGQLKANKQPLNLGDLVKSVKNNYIFTAKRKNLDLRYQGPSTTLIANVDSRQLSRVVANILSNAIKFSNKGTIDIQLAQVSGTAELTITDSGCGIEPKKLEEIFEPFKRCTDSAPGVGLGLTVCKVLTELNGGQIAILSDGKSGTTVNITLPLAIEFIGTQPAVSAVTSDLVILLYSEDLKILDRLHSDLGSKNYVVHATSNVNEVDSLFNFAEPDLCVIVDDQVNADVLKLAKQLRERSSIQLIVLAKAFASQRVEKFKQLENLIYAEVKNWSDITGLLPSVASQSFVAAQNCSK